MVIHAFMLVVVLGTGDDRREQRDPMYFRSIDVCQYYAKRIPKQYGNFSYRQYIDPKDRITAYCKPVKLDATKVQVYDH